MNTNQSLILGIVVLIVLGVGAYFLTTPDSPSGPNATSTDQGGGSTTGTGTDRTPGKPIIATNQNPVVSNSTAIVLGTITPNGSQTTYWYEYGKTSSLGNSTPPQTIGSGYIAISAPTYITGLSASTGYYYRAVASNGWGTVSGTTYTFTTNTAPPPQGSAPTTETTPATNVERTTAKVAGRVTPNGSDATYWFEYGTDTDLGNTSDLLSAGNGASAQTVTVSLSNLQPKTKYYFRMNAQNQYGTVNGAVLTFTTDGPVAAKAPTVDTATATNLATSSAKLNGTVNPNGAATTYWFEYGTDSLLGSLIGSTTHSALAGSGTANIDASAIVTNLSPNTRYYYRLVASNSEGTIRADIVNFKTK
ncbi:MAG: fibronectin type III domain-containing protein [bacterium]|nr:fibronectin type III domain-containing protein [bacterium]